MAKKPPARVRDASQQKMIDALLERGALRLWESDDRQIDNFTLEAWVVGRRILILQMFYGNKGQGHGFACYWQSVVFSMDEYIAQLDAEAPKS